MILFLTWSVEDSRHTMAVKGRPLGREHISLEVPKIPLSEKLQNHGACAYWTFSQRADGVISDKSYF